MHVPYYGTQVWGEEGVYSLLIQKTNPNPLALSWFSEELVFESLVTMHFR